MTIEDTKKSGEDAAVGDDLATFGPDAVFDPKDSQPVEFWAEISATDDSGVSVDGIKKGDEFRIIEISGMCSFAKGKSRLILSIVTTVAGAFLGGGTTAWQSAISSMRKDLDKHAKDSGTAGKKRDGYGLEAGEASHAENEGGIIICLPSSGGLRYYGDVRRVKKDIGQVQAGGWFFPSRDRVQKPYSIETDGVLRIGAFDSHHNDNAGSYEVKFSITRPRASAGTNQDS